MTKSKIFLFFCLSFIGGVFVQSVFNLQFLIWLGVFVLGVILAAVWWRHPNSANSSESPTRVDEPTRVEACQSFPQLRRGDNQGNKRIVMIGFCLMITVFGAWRYSVKANPENSVRFFNDKAPVSLVGKIINEPDIRADNIKYKISIVDKSGKNTGNILLVANKYPEYKYGDVLEVSGKLKTPSTSEDFDYKQYLAKDDIYSIIYYPEIKLLSLGGGNRLESPFDALRAALFSVKNKFENSIQQILSEPQSSLLAGLVLGERGGFSPELKNDFSLTGTTHIIALSGFNISIICLALMHFFNLLMLRRAISFWASVGVIFLFVLMTGASASVVRAAIMGILVLIAQRSGRLYAIRNALIFAGAVMVFFNPKILVFDLGFQLSFAATLGLIYVSPILERWTVGDRTLEKSNKVILKLKEILTATLAAQIAVLPLLVINFGQLSLISPLANILILPFVPVTMFWGFLAGFLGMFWLGAAKILGFVAWLLLAYEIKLIELLANLPLAAIEFKWTWIGGVIYYAVLILLIGRFGKKTKNLLLAGSK